MPNQGGAEAPAPVERQSGTEKKIGRMGWVHVGPTPHYGGRRKGREGKGRAEHRKYLTLGLFLLLFPYST